MASDQASFLSLVQRIRTKDVATADALEKLNGKVGQLDNQLNPPAESQTEDSVDTPTDPPTDVVVSSYHFTDTNVILDWERNGPEILLYEIRKGQVWEFADKLFTTGSTTATLDPTPIGESVFLIKALNQYNIYSINANKITVLTPPIGPLTLNTEVIGNFVNIDWEYPVTTFRIAYYVISKDGTVIVDQCPGTFYSRQEPAAGVFTYGVKSVDIGGNESAESLVTLEVKAPTDFDLQDTRTSQLTGTKVNARLSGDKLYLPINLTETYQQHFDSRGWASPAAQVAAGYPMWLSPFVTSGSYEEIFDFGAVINNVIVSLSWLTEVYAGSFVFALEMSTSVDGTNYTTPPSTTQSTYVTTLRYVKVKITFTGNDDKAFMSFFNLIISLSVKRENDAGFGTAIASDPTGTFVRFNKPFVDVEGITVTPVSDTATFSIFQFDDIPYPAGFSVRIYDNAGVRITRDFRWNARGII